LPPSVEKKPPFKLATFIGAKKQFQEERIMMKKKVWLVLLAMVLVSGLVMFGCGGGGGDDDDNNEVELVEKVVFDLETDEGIQALEAGAIANTEFAAPNNPLAPLVRAGENAHISLEIVDNAGKKEIKYTVVSGDWGVGIDLPNAAFGFREGDKVTVAGKVLTGDENKSVLLNVNIGAAQTALGGTEEYKAGVGGFSFEGVVSADDLKKIKAGSPSGIRLEARAVGFVLQVNTIKIVGMRPAVVTTTPLSAPTLALSGSKVTWAAVADDGVSSYKITVKKSDDTLAKEASLTAATLEYSLANDTDFGSDTYSITVVALGVKDQTTDSPASAVLKVQKVIPAGTPTNIDVSSVTPVGGTVSAISATGYTFDKTSGYANGYAYFTYTPSTNNKISDFAKIEFSYQGVSGDAGGKQLYALAIKDTAPTAYLGADDYFKNDINIAGNDVHSGNVNIGDAVPISLGIDSAKAAALDDATTVHFIFYIHANPSNFKISDVKFIKALPTTYTKVD
jgi:hypothetical protein